MNNPAQKLILLAFLGLAACSSSSGGRDTPPADQRTVVLPPGAAVVCQDGTAPPCAR